MDALELCGGGEKERYSEKPERLARGQRLLLDSIELCGNLSRGGASQDAGKEYL